MRPPPPPLKPLGWSAVSALVFLLPPPFFLVVRLLATVEGRPLPTELPKRPPPSSSGGGGKYGGGFGNGSGGGGGVDQRSMERLAGETDSEYVARQTALRGEASARMRDKFGGPNRMQGLGSDSSYNPASGGYGGGGGGGGLNADEIGGQIGVLGQKSMRFLSDSFATLQTGVKVGNRHTGGRGVMQLSIHALMMRRNWKRLLLERAGRLNPCLCMTGLARRRSAAFPRTSVVSCLIYSGTSSCPRFLRSPPRAVGVVRRRLRIRSKRSRSASL